MPANPVESTMLHALSDQNRQGYVRALTSAELYLPTADPAGPAFVTWSHGAATYLPVFTSISALTRWAGPGTGFRALECRALADSWPSSEIRVAVNPNLPIGAVLSIDEVRNTMSEELRHSGDGAVDDEEFVEFEPANAVEHALAAAMGEVDLDAYFDALVACPVVVPVEWQVSGPEAIEHPGFPWLDLTVGGVPTIPVFTSTLRLAETFPAQTPWVSIDFVAVTRNWPNLGYSLVVNPGSPIEVVLPGERISELTEWAKDLSGQDVPSWRAVPDDHRTR